jgi:hypothetical protein
MSKKSTSIKYIPASSASQIVTSQVEKSAEFKKTMAAIEKAAKSGKTKLIVNKLSDEAEYTLGKMGYRICGVHNSETVTARCIIW